MPKLSLGANFKTRAGSIAIPHCLLADAEEWLVFHRFGPSGQIHSADKWLIHDKDGRAVDERDGRMDCVVEIDAGAEVPQCAYDIPLPPIRRGGITILANFNAQKHLVTKAIGPAPVETGWVTGPKPGPEKHDMVNHPPHYKAHPSGVECIEVTRHMNFNLGNAIKYIWRAGKKGATIQDLEKAAWYLQDEIKRLKLLEQSKEES